MEKKIPSPSLFLSQKFTTGGSHVVGSLQNRKRMLKFLRSSLGSDEAFPLRRGMKSFALGSELLSKHQGPLHTLPWGRGSPLRVDCDLRGIASDWVLFSYSSGLSRTPRASSGFGDFGRWRCHAATSRTSSNR